MPSADGRTIVWAIDDASENQRMIRDCLLPDGEAFLVLEAFEEAAAAMEELKERHALADGVPDVILMDYFLGNAYGSVLTTAIRALFAPARGPVIIGHSSMPAASASIVEAGGDFTLPKKKWPPRSGPLRRVFGTRESVAEMLRTRRAT
ncbi:MAG: response regulator [Planctomycetes bacterium]|nr:response regulator [Planctomycetota bacterium]